MALATCSEANPSLPRPHARIPPASPLAASGHRLLPDSPQP
ncbi:MAG: hypothetical protein Q8P67_11540 [archaeon]|nr:hypothetical protein [archaeon]